jgi:hemerythrin-like domain-containing protein
MTIESLAEALQREHVEIDTGIAAFTDALATGERRLEPLTRAIAALRRHIYLEEEFLFPPLRAAGFTAPVMAMVGEHKRMWDTLGLLELELADGTDDAGLHRTCRALTVALHHHHPREDRILYPQAEHVLTAAAGTELRAFLDSGELPDDWVCGTPSRGAR